MEKFCDRRKCPKSGKMKTPVMCMRQNCTWMIADITKTISVRLATCEDLGVKIDQVEYHCVEPKDERRTPEKIV